MLAKTTPSRIALARHQQHRINPTTPASGIKIKDASMSCKGEVNMVSHLDNLDQSTPKKRQREQSEQEEQEEPTKRQRISQVQSPNIAPRRLPQQQVPSVTKADRPITPQPTRRKRSCEVKELSLDAPIEPLSNIAQTPVDSATTGTTDLEAHSGSTVTAVAYWLNTQNWPKEYFERDPIKPPPRRKASTSSLPQKRSEPSSLAGNSTTPALYSRPSFFDELKSHRIILEKDKTGPRTESKVLCRSLFTQYQDVPQISDFSESVFESTCSGLEGRNEAKVVQDISRLIVPSAQRLANHGAEKLECLIESVNEGWNNVVPVLRPRPQPDYSVGFKREAFSGEQLEKLNPLIRNYARGDQSEYMATWYMYFPFLTCEVKCGGGDLDIADRQNAHSMALAVRAVVELFRRVQREKEVDREILAFSVSHDNRTVRIYGHYPVVDGTITTFYRHPIRAFDFQELDGEQKWTTYKFIKSVYDTWMPTHIKRLCSAIDDLPLEVFDAPPLQQESGLSQELNSRHLSQSFAGSVIQTEGDESQSGTGVLTPDASYPTRNPEEAERKESIVDDLSGCQNILLC